MGKLGNDEFNGPQWKIDVRYEFGFKVISKDLACKRDYMSNFWFNFPAASKSFIIFVRMILPKVGVDRFTGS